MEEFIVEEIFKAIQKNNRLNVTILLDKSRGSPNNKGNRNKRRCQWKEFLIFTNKIKARCIILIILEFG